MGFAGLGVLGWAHVSLPKHIVWQLGPTQGRRSNGARFLREDQRKKCRWNEA